MTKEIIQIENLTYQYAHTDKPALVDINLSINKGEYLAIIGPCGAGKTSLALSLNGIVPHMTVGEMRGKVLVDGIDTTQTQVRDLAHIVGMVFDNPEYQLSQSTVLSEMAIGLENIGIPRDEMLKRIVVALEIVGLSGLEERSPLALSGGQQQRLAIAAALSMYPKVLVLDEPTSNLDPMGKEEVFAVTARLNQEKQMTVVIVEHEVEVIASYADRVIVLDKGQIVNSGNVNDIFSDIDSLDGIGVRSPQVTAIASGLEKKGYHFENLPVTLDGADATFSDWLKQGKALA
jgi:energy-coupling factor transporter ATP-binding protein EcfA2|tara:strand:- start:1730 stop:2599 length:870 start_codon:yes stop_codon:yes gene_type:complete